MKKRTCVICGKSLRCNERYNYCTILPICHDCATLKACGTQIHERLDISCPRCGRSFSVPVSRYRYLVNQGKVRLCGRCANELRVKRGFKPTVASRRGEIRVNGCVLRPSRELVPLGNLLGMPSEYLAARCSSYLRCPNGMYSDLLDIPKDQSCMELVSRRDWAGWTSEGVPGRITAGQLEVIRVKLTEQLGEVGFLSGDYGECI